ncbi:helix-turn-helix transcriptional regulator [Roseivivax sp. CAU 1753]
MTIPLDTTTKFPAGLALLMVVQALCVVFFTGDVIADFYLVGAADSAPIHRNIELVATLSLLAAIALEARVLRDLLRRKAHLERSLSIANTAVYEVIEAHFANWKLSPSETDVATFLVKGLDIAEIARMRNCAEGTVKAHLNAIYRKSGTRNRGELLSVLIDSLLTGTERI